MKSVAQARIKRVRALELVAEGKNYDQVAQEAGYAHRGSAHRAVFKALDEREAEGVEHLRRIEVERLDRLQAALWDRAVEGDVTVVKSVLRIIETRCRLLGLSTTRSASKPDAAGPAYLVVGPHEGNPRIATLDDVYRWSRAELEQIADDKIHAPADGYQGRR